jgi:anti-sigma B factor antagonist
MHVSSQLLTDVTVLTVTGDLDATIAAGIQHELLAGLPPRAGGADPGVVLDLSGVGHLSSAGLRSLLILHRHAERDGTRLVLTGLAPPVREVLSATGFLRFFRTAPTVGDACALLRGDGSGQALPLSSGGA